MEVDKAKAILEELRKATSVNDINIIEARAEIPEKFKTSLDKYPKIGFSIPIESIYESEYFDENWKLHQSPFMTPLEQLLYAFLWKQGDLPKLKHIIEGIESASKEPSEGKKDGLVFYHFGRHLANKNLPIIDQHVIRAFLYCRSKDEKDAESHAKFDSIDAKNTEHIKHINEYIAWCKECGFAKNSDLMFAVDRLLMSIGRSIKADFKKNNKKS